MSYTVKTIYYTLQGEGARAGRPAVLLRFAGCNLWSGREQHRAAAACRFCDTDFVGADGPGGGKFDTARELAAAVAGKWPVDAGADVPYVVCTGGEPLLQLDGAAIDALHAGGFEIGVESNGTIVAPAGIDWLCISPKGDAPVRQLGGDELKLVFPQPEPEAQPDRFTHLAFRHFYLQPLDNADLAMNTRAAIEFCLEHPRWKLSLQLHKIIGID
ncbi:MAG: 7-carboxy-7-deazaguanine synthase [Gammaproteobacteria bacterium]|nr:7-carboxy-7-deazaguanine synthase [Gammaproteobacteria bacterium]